MALYLNSKYFEKVCKEKHNGYFYHVIKPKNHPMVLFSKIDGSVLASLHLRCQDSNEDMGKAVITRRPDSSRFKCDFQGLIDKDGQEFEFVITNLSGDGNINFNIMKNDVNRLNQVNAIKPYQSYAVKCDRDTNLALVLNSIKKQVMNKNTGEMEEKKVTVKESEESSKDPDGTYYHISIFPETKRALSDKYIDTVWACVDQFVVKKQAPIMREFRYSDARFSEARFSDERQSDTGYRHQPVQSSDSSSDDMGFSLFGGPTLSEPKKQNAKTTIIDNSYIAKVSGGRKITEKSRTVKLKFNYERVSVPCVLGLSIADNLEFFDELTVEELKEEAKIMIQDLVNNSAKELLSKLTKVFKSKECVICLEEGTDTVYYQCGHQCCHYKCGNQIKKCPLCRQHISALINLNN